MVIIAALRAPAQVLQPPGSWRTTPAEGASPPRVRVPAGPAGQGAGVSRWGSRGTAAAASMSLTWVVP
jgi:hypothetical protein